MQKKLVCSLLVLTLLMGMAGTSLAAAASPPLPFGQEVIPLTEDEMEEVDGAWGATLVKTAVGAAVAGASYLLTTPRDDWNWSDGLKHTAAGALSGLAGSFF
ncbi:MAG: hypothetical protein QM451_06420 [Bacillota bacterium]|jgi:hypothetical protein|nr:hypothetical protein [Bacillota bacterium]HHT90829.1 hypothetical protein [Bacillota bacterium]